MLRDIEEQWRRYSLNARQSEWNKNHRTLEEIFSLCCCRSLSTREIADTVGENNVSMRALEAELRKEMILFYRVHYKHDIIVSLWETYQAFLANQFEWA